MTPALGIHPSSLLPFRVAGSSCPLPPYYQLLAGFGREQTCWLRPNSSWVILDYPSVVISKIPASYIQLLKSCPLPTFLLSIGLSLFQVLRVRLRTYYQPVANCGVLRALSTTNSSYALWVAGSPALCLLHFPPIYRNT